MKITISEINYAMMDLQKVTYSRRQDQRKYKTGQWKTFEMKAIIGRMCVCVCVK